MSSPEIRKPPSDPENVCTSLIEADAIAKQAVLDWFRKQAVDNEGAEKVAAMSGAILRVAEHAIGNFGHVFNNRRNPVTAQIKPIGNPIKLR